MRGDIGHQAVRVFRYAVASAEYDEEESCIDGSKGPNGRSWLSGSEINILHCLCGVITVLFLQQVLKTSTGHHEKDKENHLKRDACHENIDASPLACWRQRYNGHGCSGGLDAEGRQVECDEDQREIASFETENPVVVQVEMDHTPKDHVDVGIDPEWSKEEKKPMCVKVSRTKLIVDGESAEDVAAGLPDRADDADDSEWSVVYYCLNAVDESRCAE